MTFTYGTVTQFLDINANMHYELLFEISDEQHVLTGISQNRMLFKNTLLLVFVVLSNSSIGIKFQPEYDQLYLQIF